MSISGCVKKVVGDFLDKPFGADNDLLFFIGAGGQDKISGVLNFSALGVQQSISGTPVVLPGGAISEKLSRVALLLAINVK